MISTGHLASESARGQAEREFLAQNEDTRWGARIVSMPDTNHRTRRARHGSAAIAGCRQKTELRARIGVRAERRSATIILMSTISQIANQIATIPTMPKIVIPQPAKPAPAVVDAAWTDSAWKQLAARDPQARFFYGVATTGVFCRPTCASRRPLRANVRFFRTAAEAEAAGFRACKRCKPGSFAPSSSFGRDSPTYRAQPRPARAS